MTPEHASLNPRRFFLIIWLLTLPLMTYSQGEFLHKGTSGFVFDASYHGGKKLLNDDYIRYNGMGLVFGYSFRGVFDLQAGANPEYIPEGELFSGSEKDVGSNAFGKLAIHAVKQSDRFPFSIKGMFIYSYTEYDEANTIETKISGGMGIYRRLYLADNISFIPSFDIIYSSSKFEPTSSTADGNFEGDEVISVVSLPFAINIIRNHLLYLTPTVASGMKNSNAFYRITLGYMLPVYTRPK
jgi:hypothetical protein